MNTKILSLFKVILFFSIVASIAHAEEPVNDSFDALMNEPTNGAASIESDNSSAGQSLTLLTEDPKRDDHAMYGWSFGLQTSSEVYNATVDLYDTSGMAPSGVQHRDSNTYLNIGVVGRYSILPVDRLGSDLNVSFMQSTDLSDNGDKAVTAFKGEVNLAYTWGLSKGLKIYALIGGGLQALSGQDLDKMIQPLSTGGQAGFGVNIAAINIELMYSYYQFKINTGAYHDNILGSSSTMAVQSKSSYLQAMGAVARASYNF